MLKKGTYTFYYDYFTTTIEKYNFKQVVYVIYYHFHTSERVINYFIKWFIIKMNEISKEKKATIITSI